MAPLFGTRTRSTTVTKLRGCSVELQGSSKVGIQDTLVFLICLMCWGGRLFLKGDSRLDLFCFTKLLTVWHKCPSKASLSRRIRPPHSHYNRDKNKHAPYTYIVSRHLATRGNNKILCTPPPHTSSSEERLPRLTRRTLAQL